MNMNFYRKYIRPRLTLWRRPLKPELLKLLLAAVWFVFCIYMVALANAYADRRNPNANRPPADRYVAPDPLMEATNSWFMRSGMPQGISDTLVGVSAGLIFAFALTRGPACITIVRRALLIVGSLYLGRTPYMLLTVLPAPWRYCFTDINPNFGVDSWLLFSGQRVDCGDTFYSGHTIVFTSSAMLYWYHCRYFIITIPVLLLNWFGMISLVFSGYHYTIDVIGGAVFTFLCWWLFHLAVEIDEIGTQRWWGRLVRWFDNNGHEVLEEREGTKQLMMAATGRGGRVDVESDSLELPTIHSEQPAIVPSTLPSTQLQPPSPHRHNQRRRSAALVVQQGHQDSQLDMNGDTAMPVAHISTTPYPHHSSAGKVIHQAPPAAYGPGHRFKDPSPHRRGPAMMED
ncbi:hypothetical protein PhCBS80983_g00844 [Powellomyces hirtus]|uniref:Sphingomyelin synthase-like domain-containing protein n=1 Tax=Powellomyces hirtus TaxID=109895 RepID=A0A507ECM5_9FUNG|nr:hypothetical protein PhCBS80983_g00844 [Powellomyces hirtus]